jgi:cell division protein FtsQ
MFKKKVILFVWMLLGFGIITLLFIGAKSKGEKLCKDINVEVTLKARQVFIDVKGIKQSIADAGGKPGTPVSQINLRYIETKLRQNPWIKDLKLYFDNDQVLQAALQESDPVARIFTVSGKSFYIDSAAHYLPTNRNIVARVPVFTGFPSDKKILSKPDSAVLLGVKNIANYILNDTLWNDFTAQVDINPATGFELMPTIGDQTIRLGNAENLAEKFNRLYSFYRQVISRTGIEAFKEINVEYAGQVVAIRTGSHPPAAVTPVLQPTVGNAPPGVAKKTPRKTTTPKKKTTKNR